jgi:hypothetical protein
MAVKMTFLLQCSYFSGGLKSLCLGVIHHPTEAQEEGPGLFTLKPLLNLPACTFEKHWGGAF